MAEKKTKRKPSGKKPKSATGPKTTRSKASEPATETASFFDLADFPLLKKAAELTGDITNALQVALRTGEIPFRMGSSLLLGRDTGLMSKEQLQAMQEAGAYLHDLRQTAGLTLKELADALDLADTSLLEAVENGTATLSFDLILRLSAMVARRDPLPFIIRFARTYNPTIERLGDSWGAGRLAKQFERERQFVNVMRRHDRVREISDEGFARLLAFTAAAFELALSFIGEGKPAAEPGKAKGKTDS